MEHVSNAFIAIIGGQTTPASRVPCSVKNLFFSWKTYTEHKQAAKACSCKYLSLGELNSDWWNATVRKRIQLYKQLIVLAQPMLSESRGRNLDLNQTQVLVGHICMALAGRIARTLMQIESVNGQISLNGYSTSFLFSSPQSSSDSYKLLIHPEFSRYIDTSLLRAGHSFTDALELNSKVQSDTTRVADLATMIYSGTAGLLSPLTRRSAFLIVGSYMGRIRESFLSLVLHQPPLLVELRRHRTADSQYPSRTFIQKSNAMDVFLENALKALLPSNLLHQDSDEERRLSNAGWPTSPNAIFTSNSFDTDDDFKSHLSINWNRASYLVGQHGNNYGTSQNSLLYPETWLADKFLTWGWKDGLNSTRLAVIKPVRGSSFPRKKKGFLFVLRDENWLQVESDVDLTNEVYFRKVARFVSKLVSSGCNVRVRPHPATPNWALDLIRRESGDSQYLSFSRPRAKMSKERKAWFPVFAYDSTGMLELASVGADFLAFVPDGLDNIRTQFRQIYQHLIDLQIIHLKTESAITALLAIQDSGYTLSSQQRRAVEAFSSELAVRSNLLVPKVARILRASVKEGSNLASKHETRWPKLD